MNTNERGFTLVEVLLVVSLTMAIGFAAITFSIPQLRASRVEGFVEDMASLVFLYQQRAASGKNGKSYGVYFDTDSYTMYVGDSYTTAESTEELFYPADMSGVQVNLDDAGREIVFPSQSFHPSTFGTVRVTNGSASYILVINREGLIYSYEE